MTFGEKLSRLRKESNFTQEQLAEILEVSRQSVSKWESDLAYPETEKLIRLGKLFDCSMDYLLKENCDRKTGGEPVAVTRSGTDFVVLGQFQERKSKRMVFGMPLYHIARNARGFFAVGLWAHGVISLGLFSTGIVSVGLLAVGLLSFGTLAFGLLSAGSIALGLLTAGAISVGIVSFGALSMGWFSAGAMAMGKYFAIGDNASGMIALGKTEAMGTLYQHIGKTNAGDLVQVRALLDAIVPGWLAWAKELVKILLL